LKQSTGNQKKNRPKYNVHTGNENILQVKETLMESPDNIVHSISNENKGKTLILVIKALRPENASILL